ncbi:hypothetical protein G7Y89_g3543 [Cudoniella acicularis]|uniref:Uncharacterized protein n=1 Tax=Cudoniella acicularis TaxID=354080 RepID=A0A8H4W8A0_9HELO|nr:hypothetical protein G7Y89_g3543 [Cudoniella acicularis]
MDPSSDHDLSLLWSQVGQDSKISGGSDLISQRYTRFRYALLFYQSLLGLCHGKVPKRIHYKTQSQMMHLLKLNSAESWKNAQRTASRCHVWVKLVDSVYPFLGNMSTVILCAINYKSSAVECMNIEDTTEMCEEIVRRLADKANGTLDSLETAYDMYRILIENSLPEYTLQIEKTPGSLDFKRMMNIKEMKKQCLLPAKGETKKIKRRRLS